MTGAKATRADFSSIILPEISACEDKAREMQDSESKLESSDLDSHKIISAIMSNAVRLTSRELRSLPYCIFESEFQDYNPTFTERVLERFGNKSNFWRRLFRAWVFHYTPNTRLGEFVSQCLKRNRRYLLASQVRLIDLLGICDGELSRERIFEQLIEKNDDDLAYKIGLKGGVGTTKLAVAALNALADYLGAQENSEEQIARFIELSSRDKEVHRSLSAAVMVGVIRGGDKLDLDSAMSKKCRELVEANYPDPSVDKNKWPSVPEMLGGEKARDECIEIVRRWRVFQSINLFFKVIGETTTDPEVKHHFPRRKDFWLSYFKQNAVSEAWILLGSKADKYMSRLKNRGDAEIQSLSYAQLGGARYDQSVLLLKVGSLTVMEWSHSGACRVWQSNSKLAPKLYQERYMRQALISESEDRITHDHHGNWQAKLHRIIRDKGGVRRRV
jgi:hypothetical protein